MQLASGVRPEAVTAAGSAGARRSLLRNMCARPYTAVGCGPGPAAIARHCGRLPGPTIARLAAATLARLERRRRLQVRAVGRNVAALLGEPLARAERIAAASLDGNTTFYAHAQWLSRQSAERRRRHVGGIAFPDEADFVRLLNTAPARPLVVVSAHMQGYLDATLRLCAAVPAHRPIAIIRRAPPSAHERLFTGVRNGPDPLLLRSYQRPGLQALGTLRAGGVLLVMLDVPATLEPGTTAPVDLLGMPAQLPVGPVELALRAHALVLPAISSAAGITCWPLLDAAAARNQRPARRARMLGRLATLLGAAIRSAPSGWLLWAHLPAFRDVHANAAAGSRTLAPPDPHAPRWQGHAAG